MTTERRRTRGGVNYGMCPILPPSIFRSIVPIARLRGHAGNLLISPGFFFDGGSVLGENSRAWPHLHLRVSLGLVVGSYDEGSLRT